MPSSNHTSLLAEGRRRKIRELVEQTGQVTVRDVVKRFAVSAVTARSDLDALSSKGGGASFPRGAVRYEPTQDNDDPPADNKKNLTGEGNYVWMEAHGRGQCVGVTKYSVFGISLLHCRSRSGG